MSGRLLKPSVLASIGRLDLIARVVVEGFLAGLHRGSTKGLAQEFTQHRAYQQGDEIRHVDWRIFGRTNRLYVKEFEDETNTVVRLVIDASASLAFKPSLTAEGESKFDYAKYLAASIAYLAVRQNDRVSLMAFNETLSLCQRPGGGRSHLYRILSLLDNVEPAGQTNFCEQLMREAKAWAVTGFSRGLLILISDLNLETSELIDTLRRIRQARTDVIVFHLIDRVEKELNLKGTFEFHDLETGERLLADVESIRHNYHNLLNHACTAIRRELARYGIDYIEMDTSGPLDHALAGYLKRRRG